MPVRHSRLHPRIAIFRHTLTRALLFPIITIVFSLVRGPVASAQAPSVEAVTDEHRLIERLHAFIQSTQQAADSSTPPRCGTTALLPIVQARSSLSIATRRLLQPYLTRPTQPGEENRTGIGHSYTTPSTFYFSPGGHFKIWYVTTGPDRPGAGRSEPPDANGNGIPDWVEQCAEAFEHSWRTEIDTLAYRPPIVDFQYHAQYSSLNLDDGGDDKFDVYIEDLGTGIAGYTAPEVVISGRKLPAYIVVDNDFAGVRITLAGAIGLLQVTAAHEFFHAVQFGYDADEDTYWFEQTAVWMEEQVFDAVDDYLSYLNTFSGFLTEPWVSLDAQNGQHEFAGVLWPLYLSQRFGQVIIRRIWEQVETVQSLDAMNLAIHAQSPNDSLKTAFREFTTWNVFTGPRADTRRYYREGDLYHGVVADTVRFYPASGPGSSPRSPFPSHLAANYIFFYPDSTRSGGLRIDFTGLTGDWGVSVVGVGVAGVDTIATVTLAGQHGTAAVYDWGDYSVLVLIPAALNRSGSNFQYTYSAIYDPRLIRRPRPPTYALTNFPNPFNTGTTIRYDLPAVGRVVITIYNILGQEIRTLVDAQRPSGRYDEPWDGLDASGRKVASGLYFYQLTVSDASGVLARVSKKMTLVK